MSLATDPTLSFDPYGNPYTGDRDIEIKGFHGRPSFMWRKRFQWILKNMSLGIVYSELDLKLLFFRPTIDPSETGLSKYDLHRKIMPFQTSSGMCQYRKFINELQKNGIIRRSPFAIKVPTATGIMRSHPSYELTDIGSFLSDRIKDGMFLVCRTQLSGGITNKLLLSWRFTHSHHTEKRRKNNRKNYAEFVENL